MRKTFFTLTCCFLLLGLNSAFAKKGKKIPKQETSSMRVVTKHKINQKKFDCNAQSTFQMTIGGSTYQFTVNVVAPTCQEAGAIMDAWAAGTAAGLAFTGGVLWQY